MKYLRAGESEACSLQLRAEHSPVRGRMLGDGADAWKQVGEERCRVQEPRDTPMP